MKISTTTKLLSALIAASVAGYGAQADESRWDQPGFYMGGNIGQSSADIDKERILQGLTDSGFSSVVLEDDGKDTGYKLFAGYQLSRYFALEAGYFDLGEFTFMATTLPPGTLDGSIKVRGLNLDLVGYLPMGERWSAFGRVGVNYAEAKDAFTGTGLVQVTDPNPKDRKANVKLGVGLQYAFNQAVAMRLEAERYRIGDGVGNKGDVDLVSLGVVYKFGTSSEPVYQAPIAQAPVEATPVAAPAPAPRKFEKQTLSATELFAFNSAEVNLPQPKLEAITTALKGSDAPKQITITGYTDNLGSDDYNQKLSERRAVAVKNYMVGQGVEASRLRAEGRGEADPVVTCDNKQRSALIECLSPNRRVEIDQITITKDASY